MSKPRRVEQIIRILRQGDGGQTVAEICREHNIAAGTCYRWKKLFGWTYSVLLDAKKDRLVAYCA